MQVSLGKKFFIYTGIVLTAVLLLAFAALERYQSRQWEEFLHTQSLSFARFSTPEILKQFRGNFPPSDDLDLSNVYDFLGFNRDLIRFSIYSRTGRELFESPQFPDFIDTELPHVRTDDFAQRLNVPRASVKTLQLGEGRRALDLLIPAFGPTGEHLLSVHYLISFDSVDSHLAEMHARFLEIGSLALIGAILLAAMVARRISRPLTVLADGARAIGQGDFATRIPIERNDEIGALARAFNEMATSLCQSNDALTEKNVALHDANAELTRVQSQLIRSERLAAIGQLAAGVSHEIDNPIGIILGYAELLLEEQQDDEEKRADLQAIIDECYRCRRITGGLLGFARSHTDSLEQIDLLPLIKGTIASLRPQKLFKEVVFDLRGFEGDTPIVLSGDRDRLRQVLVNLLLNAAQAMQGRGAISLTVDASMDSVRITITDSGPGVPADLSEQIFDPFFSTKPSGEGTGLGLSLCRRLVEEHGGELSLASPDGAGASFVLELPLQIEKTL